MAYLRTMAGVKTCGILILCDIVLWLTLYTVLVLLECTSCGGLAGIWAIGAVRLVFLHPLTFLLTDGKPQSVAHRWVALLCILLPAFESCRVLTEQRPPSDDQGPFPDPGMVVLALVSSTVACVVWEAVFPDDGGIKEGKKKLDARALLMRVVRYFRPDVLHLIGAFVSLILGVICDTYIPFYQGEVIDMLTGQHLQTSFYHAIKCLALVSLGSSLCSGLRGSMFMWTLSRLNKRMKHMLFHNLLKQDIHFFDENKPGNLSARLHSDVDKMGRAVALNANVLVRSVVKTGLMLYLMLGLSWELTLLTCIEMPLMALLQNKYTTYSQIFKDKMQDCQAQAKEMVTQTFNGIQTVRSFKGEKEELQRYNDTLEQMYNVKWEKSIYSAVLLLIRRVVSLGVKVVMLYQGRRLISSGQLSIGRFLTLVLYQKPMMTNMKEIVFGIGDMVSTVGVIDKVFNFLDRKPKCKEAGDLAPEKLEGRVTFNNVTFSYPSTPDTPALKALSLELQPGKITALVGPSGGGKSTCVQLLKRLYEPQDGQILLDGQPLHHYQHKYLHQKVALVSQNPVLFSGSVSHNIQYGLKDCTLERVKEAAKRANADGFISEMEKEYDTDIGEHGGKLAGGQKQCIAIARALVREPQVLILDEATSWLDINMQHAVVQEVLANTKVQTVLVVAHQLKTVEKADLIIFIENGAIVEQGTHKELMDRKGRYHWLKEELFT